MRGGVVETGSVRVSRDLEFEEDEQEEMDELERRRDCRVAIEGDVVI